MTYCTLLGKEEFLYLLNSVLHKAISHSEIVRLHGDWNNIDRSAVSSALAFVEQLLLEATGRGRLAMVVGEDVVMEVLL